MMSSIFSTQKKLVYRISKESPRDQKIFRAKYNRLMQSRPIFMWAR